MFLHEDNTARQDTLHDEVLEWLAQSVRDVSIPVCGVEMPGHEAVMAGWEALHLAVNTMGIQSVEGLSEWIHGQGFPQPRWGAHFSGRAQERLLNSAAHINARVTSLESAYVQAVLQACEHGAREVQEARQTRVSSRTFSPGRCTVGGVGRCQFGRSFQQTFSCVAELSIPGARKIQTSDTSGSGDAPQWSVGS